MSFKLSMKWIHIIDIVHLTCFKSCLLIWIPILIIVHEFSFITFCSIVFNSFKSLNIRGYWKMVSLVKKYIFNFVPNGYDDRFCATNSSGWGSVGDAEIYCRFPTSFVRNIAQKKGQSLIATFFLVTDHPFESARLCDHA